MRELPTEETMARVLKVPDRYRAFEVSAPEAMRSYGFDEPLLAELMNAGLPYKGTRGDVLFSRRDMVNISLDLRLASTQWSVMKWWARSLPRQSGQETGDFQVRVSWKCPDPGHDGACAFTFAPQIAAAVQAIGAEEIIRRDNLILSVSLPCEKHDFGEAFHAVAQEARQLRFHYIPDELTEDIDFIRETRLADCRSANWYLMGLAEQAGFTVRPACGYFVGAPFPCPHSWFEVLVEDRWLAADPFYLAALQRWDIIPADNRLLNHTPRGMLWVTSNTLPLDVSLVEHGREHAVVNVHAQYANR